MAEVDVGGLGVEFELVLGGQAVEVIGFAVEGHAGGAQLGGFFEGGLAPRTGDDVIGRGAGGAQVHGQHGELQAGAALQEHDLVVGGDAEQLAQVGFGGLDDAFELLGAVAHLHHRHAAALVIEHFGLGFFEDGHGQHGGSGVEIVDTFDWSHVG